MSETDSRGISDRSVLELVSGYSVEPSSISYLVIYPPLENVRGRDGNPTSYGCCFVCLKRGRSRENTIEDIRGNGDLEYITIEYPEYHIKLLARNGGTLMRGIHWECSKRLSKDPSLQQDLSKRWYPT